MGAAKEAGLALWQLQLRHDAKTSVLVNAYDVFAAFLLQDPELPQSLAELEEKALIKIVVNLSQDAGDAGTFVRWCPCSYVAGHNEDALHNCMFLLDAFSYTWQPKATRIWQ